MWNGKYHNGTRTGQEVLIKGRGLPPSRKAMEGWGGGGGGGGHKHPYYNFEGRDQQNKEFAKK